LESTSIDEGIVIDLSEEQAANSNSPRLEILQPGSNVTFESDVHFMKQLLEPE
jgi:hypothetical protein